MSFKVQITCALVGAMSLAGCQDRTGADVRVPILSAPTHVIYGEDGRQEPHAVQDPAWRERAASTVAIIGSEKLADLGDGVTSVHGVSYGETHMLCADEPFYEQKKAPHCSGFLVAPDIIVTAGHCVPTRTECELNKFVFGYAMGEDGGQPDTVRTEDVYGCGKLIRSGLFPDFAVVRLDRPVVGRAPLPLRRTGSVETGAPLVVIGHPMGLPLKIATGASVRSVSGNSFVAESDTYKGNSGSAVFNAETGEVEGVLVRGEVDFERVDSCYVSKRCQEGECAGEGATKISEVLHSIDGSENQDDGPDSSELDGPGTVEFEAAGLELVIPNGEPTAVESSIEAAEAPAGRHVYVSVDISHTYRGDLRIVLVAPGGREFLLKAQDFFDSGDDLVGIYGVDFDSVDDLSPLSSLEEAGTWILRVVDTAPSDEGMIESWSVIFVRN